MHILSNTFWERFTLGEWQTHDVLTVLPITSDLPSGVDYLTLDEALKAGTLHVTEISEGGSVPQLAVINDGPQPVLLLDGEELVGAKQNRVVNTSILLSPHSKTVIPVSCVEMGRWSYESREFRSSDHVMPADIRARKMSDVSKHLAIHGMRASNQSAVWNEVDSLAMDFNTQSRTHAMQDVFNHVKHDVDALVKPFKPAADQRGFVLCVRGHIAGIEYLSSARAFGCVYSKLLRSYALVALRRRDETPVEPDKETVRRLLAAVPTARIQSYPAIGLGHEHRIDSMQTDALNTSIQGVALTLEEVLVHLSLLPVAFRPPYKRSDGAINVFCD